MSRRAPSRHLQSAIPVLVGTKFDLFYTSDKADQAETLKQARKYAKAMKAPLIFSSASHGINIQKMFKLVFCKVGDMTWCAHEYPKHCRGRMIRCAQPPLC